MSKFSGTAAAVLLGCSLLAGHGQAGASSAQEATAAGAVGSVDIVVGQDSVRHDPIASCEVGGTLHNGTSGVSVGAGTEYGVSETRCQLAQGGTASVRVSGTRFETAVLAGFGGPVIRARTFTARCATTGNGSRSYVSLGGVRGITVPSDIPANHTITVAGRDPGDPPMAKVVLNELVAPTPPDGSLTAHAMRIELFPEGGPASGEIVVGTASCDPYPAP